LSINPQVNAGRRQLPLTVDYHNGPKSNVNLLDFVPSLFGEQLAPLGDDFVPILFRQLAQSTIFGRFFGRQLPRRSYAIDSLR
jgi:hypothetical protein